MDAHSKWLQVEVVSSTTSGVTIKKLRPIFSTNGLPEMLVSDNGYVFTSAEFQNFMKSNGIRHVTSAPYHPASNALAERVVQTLKESLKKTTTDSIQTRFHGFSSITLSPHTPQQEYPLLHYSSVGA